MTSGYRNSAGVDADDLFDPDVQGDGYAATFLRRSDGTPLKFASASYGTPGDVFGFRDASGVDVGPKWAKKGTAQYALPINGQTFNADRTTRGGASLDLNMNSDGTYSVVRTTDAASTLASGNWLPSGGAVSDYSCDFSYAINDENVVGTGTNSVTNGASSASALTTTRTFTQRSTANQSQSAASRTGTITMHLYKSGVLKSTTTVTFETSVTGG